MKDEPLWRLSIETTREAEDAVADLLRRAVGPSVSSFSKAESEEAIVTVFLKKSARGLTTRIHQDLGALRRSGLDLGSGKVIRRRVPRTDWSDSWKKFFRPIEVGRRLLVKPSWSPRRATPGQSVVILNPGLSFGTGQHATTAYCLRELVRRRRNVPAQAFLDVGCGSGILSVAAAKLGYAPVEGFDFDAKAVDVSRANARRNRVTDRIRFARRDVRRLSETTRRRFSVVCANLTADLLLTCATKFAARLEPGGFLILAGILRQEFETVRAAYESAGFALRSARSQREWRSGSFQSPE